MKITGVTLKMFVPMIFFWTNIANLFSLKTMMLKTMTRMTMKKMTSYCIMSILGSY